MIKKQNDYVLVESEDLIIAMQQANANKDDIFPKLEDLFSSDEGMTDEGLYKIKSNSKIYKYLKTVDSIVFEGEFITLDLLAISLARSIYECNHEMEKYLKNYFRLLSDIKINNDDEKLVINLILADDKVMKYINKYNSTDDYIESMIKKRIDEKSKDVESKSVELKDVKQQKSINKRSYVEM